MAIAGIRDGVLIDEPAGIQRYVPGNGRVKIKRRGQVSIRVPAGEGVTSHGRDGWLGHSFVIQHRLRSDRRPAVALKADGVTVFLPVGVYVFVLRDGCREIKRSRHLFRVFVPANERVSRARRRVRLGRLVTVNDDLTVNRRSTLRVEGDGILAYRPVRV